MAYLSTSSLLFRSSTDTYYVDKDFIYKGSPQENVKLAADQRMVVPGYYSKNGRIYHREQEEGDQDSIQKTYALCLALLSEIAKYLGVTIQKRQYPESVERPFTRDFSKDITMIQEALVPVTTKDTTVITALALLSAVLTLHQKRRKIYVRIAVTVTIILVISSFLFRYLSSVPHPDIDMIHVCIWGGSLFFLGVAARVQKMSNDQFNAYYNHICESFSKIAFTEVHLIKAAALELPSGTKGTFYTISPQNGDITVYAVQKEDSGVDIINIEEHVPISGFSWNGCRVCIEETVTE